MLRAELSKAQMMKHGARLIKDTAVHSKRCRLLLLIVAESWRASVALAKLKTDNHNNLIGMITENQKLLSFSLT